MTPVAVGAMSVDVPSGRLSYISGRLSNICGRVSGLKFKRCSDYSFLHLDRQSYLAVKITS